MLIGYRTEKLLRQPWIRDVRGASEERRRSDAMRLAPVGVAKNSSIAVVPLSCCIDSVLFKVLRQQLPIVDTWHDIICGAQEKGTPEAVIAVQCDISIPAARPDVLHEDNVDDLDTRLVLQGANIPCTAAVEARLHERGVLCLPDFIANAGGVICAACEYAGMEEQEAFETIESKIRTNTAEVLERARHERVLPRQVAMVIARQRVEAAMATRRWSVF